MDEPGVAIDEAHLRLIHGLVCSLKPESVLELGFGSGKSAESILDALAFNCQFASYTLVDNWADWGGVRPPESRVFAERHPGAVEFCEMAERDFVQDALGQYQFILSDADHVHAGEWFADVYDRLLAPGGIAVFHDVRQYPSLAEMVSECERLGLRHVVFDQCSRPGEACQRGLLCVFKPAGEEPL